MSVDIEKVLNVLVISGKIDKFSTMNSVLILPAIILVVAVAFRLFPPKKINWFYGYRQLSIKFCARSAGFYCKYFLNMIMPAKADRVIME